MLGTKALRISARPWRHRLLPSSPRLSRQLLRHCSSPSSPTNALLPKPPADHRDLGLQQELFTTSIYSPGSPIFLPAGALIFNRLVEFLRQKYVKYGFQEVITPTIYKKALWAKSGHLENYAEDMFTVTSTSPARRDIVTNPDNNQAGEEDEYGLKPMNCPGHCLIFAAQHKSYRDLPTRYADFSPLHRNEISGALSGLTRVRRFHQDDGHIFCMPSQIEDEIKSTLDFVKETYDTLRLGPYRLVLSTRPEEHYIGTLEEWNQAEDALKNALDHTGQEWTLNEGDGAFYGPKIDIVLRDSDGKEHQTATIQLDFQLPKRFDLEYDIPAEEGMAASGQTSDRARPVLIHRAVLGSVERLMALLIEHYNGAWPFWLNPRQVCIVTVNTTDPVFNMAQDVKNVLLDAFHENDTPSDYSASERTRQAMTSPERMAVDIDNRAMSMGRKLIEARKKGYGVIVIVGPKNVESRTIDVNVSGIPSEKGEKSEMRGLKPTRLREYLIHKVRMHE